MHIVYAESICDKIRDSRYDCLHTQYGNILHGISNNKNRTIRSLKFRLDRLNRDYNVAQKNFHLSKHLFTQKTEEDSIRARVDRRSG